MTRNKKFFVFLFLLLALSVAYLPAYQYSYVFHDGVWFFKNDPGTFGIHPLHMTAVRLGRFVGAWHYTFLGWFIDSIEDLKILRFLSVFQLAFCAALFVAYLQKPLGSTLAAIFSSILIFTQPPFQVLVSSEGNAFIVPAVWLSFIAGLLAKRVPYQKNFGKQMLDPHYTAAVLLLFYSISIYQTAAMYYWVMVMLCLLSQTGRSVKEVIKSAGRFFSVGFMALFIYAAVLFYLKQYYAEYLKTSYNLLYYAYAVEFNLLRKLKWFVQEPLINSLNLWNIFPQVRYAIMVAGFIGSGFLLRIFIFMKREKNRTARRAYLQKVFLYSCLFFILFLLSFLPNLIAQGDAPFYRCCLGLTTMIVIALIFSIKSWTGILPDNIRNKVFTLILLLLSLAGICKSYQTVLHCRALPSYFEKNYVKNILKNTPLDQDKTIYLIRPDFSSLGLKRRYDEFGTLTTHYGGNKRAFLAAILRELGMKNTKEYVEGLSIVYILSVEDWYQFEDSAFVIDMRKLWDK